MLLISPWGQYFCYYILITPSREFHCGIFIHVYKISLSQHWPRFQMKWVNNGTCL